MRRRYSKAFFPDRRDYLRYLDDFTKKLGLRVRYNTNVSNISKIVDDDGNQQGFRMQDDNKNIFKCRYVYDGNNTLLVNILLIKK